MGKTKKQLVTLDTLNTAIETLNQAIEDLATMTANGFYEMNERFEKRFGGIEVRLDKIEVRLDTIETRLEKIELEIDRMNNRLYHYLELSDKRYLELKRRDLILTKWVQAIAKKTGVTIDTKELEKFTSS
jgi:tryptophan 2,3-dioxygenase